MGRVICDTTLEYVLGETLARHNETTPGDKCNGGGILNEDTVPARCVIGVTGRPTAHGDLARVTYTMASESPDGV